MTKQEYSDALLRLFSTRTRAEAEKLWDEDLSKFEGSLTEELAGMYERHLEELDLSDTTTEDGRSALLDDHPPSEDELEYVRDLVRSHGITPLEDR